MTENSERSDLSDQFPLHRLEDYDAYYPHHAWAVGIKSTFPSILKKRLIASVMATQMGSASVDYIVKRYFTGAEDAEPIARKDLEAINFIERSHSWLHGLVERLTYHDDDNVGRIMAELTMMRQEYTASCILFVVNRGAVFEGYSLLRMQMEQFAWLVAADRKANPEEVKAIRAQSSLRELDKILPGAARQYGVLSAHAHWSYDAHIRAVTSKDGRLGVLFGSVEHKAELLAHSIRFVALFALIIGKLREQEIAALAASEMVLMQLRDTIAHAGKLADEIEAMVNESH